MIASAERQENDALTMTPDNEDHPIFLANTSYTPELYMVLHADNIYTVNHYHTTSSYDDSEDPGPLFAFDLTNNLNDQGEIMKEHHNSFVLTGIKV